MGGLGEGAVAGVDPGHQLVDQRVFPTAVHGRVRVETAEVSVSCLRHDDDGVADRPARDRRVHRRGKLHALESRLAVAHAELVDASEPAMEQVDRRVSAIGRLLVARRQVDRDPDLGGIAQQVGSQRFDRQRVQGDGAEGGQGQHARESERQEGCDQGLSTRDFGHAPILDEFPAPPECSVEPLPLARRKHAHERRRLPQPHRGLALLGHQRRNLRPRPGQQLSPIPDRQSRRAAAALFPVGEVAARDLQQFRIVIDLARRQHVQCQGPRFDQAQVERRHADDALARDPGDHRLQADGATAFAHAPHPLGGGHRGWLWQLAAPGPVPWHPSTVMCDARRRDARWRRVRADFRRQPGRPVLAAGRARAGARAAYFDRNALRLAA